MLAAIFFEKTEDIETYDHAVANGYGDSQISLH